MTITAWTQSGRTDTMVRAAILAAPLAGALELVGNLGTFDGVGYGIPQPREAATAVGAGYVAGQLVGSVLTPLWVLALLAYTAPLLRARRTLSAAAICWVVGAGFTLAALGVVTYAIPGLAHAYQNGDVTAMNIADSFFTWPRVGTSTPPCLSPSAACRSPSRSGPPARCPAPPWPVSPSPPC